MHRGSLPEHVKAENSRGNQLTQVTWRMTNKMELMLGMGLKFVNDRQVGRHQFNGLFFQDNLVIRHQKG